MNAVQAGIEFVILGGRKSCHLLRAAIARFSDFVMAKEQKRRKFKQYTYVNRLYLH